MLAVFELAMSSGSSTSSSSDDGSAEDECVIIDDDDHSTDSDAPDEQQATRLQPRDAQRLRHRWMEQLRRDEVQVLLPCRARRIKDGCRWELWGQRSLYFLLSLQALCCAMTCSV